MLIAAIETSGRAGSIALFHGQMAFPSPGTEALPFDVRPLDQAGRRHARTLVAELDRLFRDHGHTLADCQAVAVSIGPGSFTGLRVGVACAKTLAWATGCRLLAVDTLQCVALQSPDDVNEPWAISDAQRGDLAVRRYHRSADGLMQPADDLHLEPAEEWCGQRNTGEFVIGPALAKYRPLLETRCQVAAAEICEPLAGSVLRLALPRLAAGETDDAWTLEPHYTRRSAAEEKADAGAKEG